MFSLGELLMKPHIVILGLLVGLIFLSSATLRLLPSQAISSGTIQLSIVNPSCANLSPETNESIFFTPEDLNNGALDTFEIQAINEGCTLQAIAIAPNGMRLTDIPLLLIRSDLSTFVAETFGGSRHTDDYGIATWTFQLIPNTDFIYQVISPHPVGQTVGSNPLEIELCTGESSENAFPHIQSLNAGRGCR
jgi:hypothetical protein